jgi:predicted dehydrogenase
VSSAPYEVLIIGCGNIAGGFDVTRAPLLPPLSHAGAYARHDGFRLRACVDPDSGRRQSFALRWDVAEQAANVEELGVLPGTFDVISICSPSALHHEHLLQALALRPKVIFCEKPLCFDLANTSEHIRDCHLQGTTLMVNYSRRWDQTVAEVFSQIKSGCWGRVRSVVGHYNKGILNNGSHMIDLLLWLMGPLELVATACPQFDFLESDPTVAVLLTATEGSVPIYLNPANARDYAYFELEIVCELGVIRMESGGISWQFRDVVPSPQYFGYRTPDVSRYVDGHYLESMECAINNIYAHLRNGAPISSSAEDAFWVESLCSQIQREALIKSSTHNKLRGKFYE